MFVVDPDQSVSGNADAGVALLNAFNYISDVKDAYSGLAFITSVSFVRVLILFLSVHLTVS